MSDQPLFQNTDEQEAIYAPHQLPDGTAGDTLADVDDRGRGSERDTTNEIGVPAAGAGLLGQTGGGISGAIAGGTTSTTGPSVGGAAPEDETRGPGLSDE